MELIVYVKYDDRERQTSEWAICLRRSHATTPDAAEVHPSLIPHPLFVDRCIENVVDFCLKVDTVRFRSMTTNEIILRN